MLKLQPCFLKVSVVDIRLLVQGYECKFFILSRKPYLICSTQGSVAGFDNMQVLCRCVFQMFYTTQSSLR